MTISLALPLPEDVDVSDMPHMPLFDQKLMKSRAWLSAKSWRGEGPGLAFALLNLWVAAFRTVPAGSLEHDDEVLADQAGVSMEHWLGMKEKALRGWKLHCGRVWHPIICELAWDLWTKRLHARHHNAHDSWRMACKRATDKGIPPPDPPGAYNDWLAARYPGTFAYRAAMEKKAPDEYSGGPPDIADCSANIGPKRSEAKDIPPIIPRDRPVDTGQEGQGRTGKAERQRWFAAELARLQQEFRPMLNTMLSNLQRPGASGEFGLVQTFRGCWIQRNARGQPEIVARSVQQAGSIMRQHGHWLTLRWPELVIRHAKVDELRGRPAA